MAKELAKMEYRELRQMLGECQHSIGEICDSVSSTAEVQQMIQQMLGQPDLLEAFLSFRRTNPDAAAQLFTAGFSVLVNSQTSLALDRELLRRSATNN